MSAPLSFRAGRAALLVLLAVLAGLLSDWLRQERVVFPRPLPEITTAP